MEWWQIIIGLIFLVNGVHLVYSVKHNGTITKSLDLTLDKAVDRLRKRLDRGQNGIFLDKNSITLDENTDIKVNFWERMRTKNE